MGMKPGKAVPLVGVVTRERAQEAADFLKLFAHTSRLLIVCSLVEAERSVGELETLLGIRQPTLSQQLGELREARIIEGRREAKQVFYRISDQRALALVSMLHGQFCGGEGATQIAAVEVATSTPAQQPNVPRQRPRSTEAARFARIEIRPLANHDSV